MRKLWLIAWQEYQRHVLRKRFLGALLAPLLFLAIGAIVAFITIRTFADSDTGVVGYVDPGNALAQARPSSDAETAVTFRRFEDEAAAKAALQSEQIIGYYQLAPDFAQTGKADLFYWQHDVSNDVRSDFRQFARTALVSGVAPQVAERLMNGIDFTFETPDQSRVFGGDQWVSFVLPLVFGLMFFISLFAGAQYLMQAVIEEKENRTMEVLVTTVTPTQLIGGKIIGLGALGLTQTVVWLAAIVVAVVIGRRYLPFLAGVYIAPELILMGLVLFVLEYILFGAAMTAIGSAVLDQKQAQQYTGPLVLLSVSPQFFIPVLLIDPNGPISTALSLFPFTAPMTLVFRYGITTVPAWQIIVATVLLAVTAAGALWLAGRVFRLGMLRYGRALAFKEIVSSVQQPAAQAGR